jgi:NitT/TauT family transport system permease protein
MVDVGLQQRSLKSMPPVRAEFVIENVAAGRAETVEQPLPFAARLWNLGWLRKALILVVLAAAWEVYARYVHNPLLFPTFSDTVVAFWSGMVQGPLLMRAVTSIRILMFGYAAGLVLAAVFVTFAISTRIGTDLISTLTAMFNPLPAIALLPLALLWFGLSTFSIVFVIIHSVLWAVSLNMHTGFLSVSPTLRMAGQNCGLRGVAYVVELLIPAAFPSILAGLKIGWAFAWRTQVGAELVFGMTTNSGGLGWFIFENRNLLETASVFAGLMTVIIVGLVVEGVIFRTIEQKTVRRWGMLR